MSLRRKAFLIASLTSAGLLAALMLILSIIWGSNTDQLEQQQAQQTMTRISMALSSELAALDRLTNDWAGWNDTYAFIVDHNPEYIADNLTLGAFTRDKLNAVLLIDLAGQIVYSQTADFQTQELLPFSSQWVDYLPVLTQHETITSAVTGLILSDNKPMLVAARPILTSLYEGPIRGTLIMGRYLSAAEIQILQQITGLSLDVLPVASTLPRDFQQAYAALYASSAQAAETTPNGAYSFPLNTETLASYVLALDVQGRPAVLVRAQLPRLVHQQTQASLWIIFGALLLTCTIFGALTLWLLDRFLLRRLARLEIGLSRITASGDLSDRVPIDSADELGRLSGGVNNMLAALEHAQRENTAFQQETQRQLNELSLLHTAALATASSSSLDEALQEIARSAYTAFQALNAMVILCSPDCAEAEIRASEGVSAETLLTRRFLPGEGLIGWVAQTGEAVLVNDVSQDARYFEADPRTRSEICAPLKIGSRVIGMLNVESDRLNAFSPGDLQLLRTLAHNLSALLENLRLLEELRAANERLQEVDRLKTRFVANMSHELRTPLNAILGFGELLVDEIAGPINDEQRDYAQHIYTSGQHLLELINDILDLSKLQAGRIQLEPRPLRLIDLVAEARPLVWPAMQRKRQTLQVDLPSDLPSLQADPLRVKQVLVNLLNNAHKFSPENGIIAVSAELWQTDWLRVSIGDNGPGIPPDKQAEIFEEFSQLEPASSLDRGTGLGLSIARRLIELHGGELWVTSTGLPGEGATFHFTLPYAASLAVSSAATRLLIVDDDPVVIEVLRSILLPPEFEVAATTDVKHVQDRIIHDLPDVVLLDLWMPGLNGFDMLTVLRQHPRTSGLPLIVLTAGPLAADEQAEVDRLAHATVLKSQLRRSTLLNTIRQTLRQTKAEPAG